MSDLISRLDAIDALEAKKDKTAKGNIGQFYNTIIQRDIAALIDLPTIDAVEVVHGEWISGYDGFEWDVRCSVCGEEALIKEGGSHDHAYSNYCPNCGAKMRKEQNDEQKLD